MNLRKLTSWLFKLLAGVVALMIVLVLAVIFVNRNDEAPSQAVQSLKRVIESRAPVADRDNAYVYAIGFSAPDDADTLSEGIAQVEWLRKFLATAGPAQFADPPGRKRDSSESRDPELKQFSNTCKEDNRGCLDALESDPVRLQAWVQRDAKLIERYEGLLEFRQWRELWPSDLRSPAAPLNHVIEAQRMTFVKTWLMAGKGDAPACKRMLERDLRFWRMVLSETSSLIDKMIAARAIEQHFAMGNLVLHRLPPEVAANAIPDGWRDAISASERSMAIIMANEWAFADKSLGPAAVSAYYKQDDADPESPVTKMLTKFLLQPQATSNVFARRMQQVAELFDRDYAALPSAAEVLLAAPEFANEEFELSIYNPIGNILADIGDMKTFINYGFRVANLEGARRLALLAVQLRAREVKDEGIVDSLHLSELRDPHDGSPFAWSEQEKSILFHRTLRGKPDLKIAY